MRDVNIDVTWDVFRCVFTLEQAQALCSGVFAAVRDSVKVKQQAPFDERCRALEHTVTETAYEHQLFTIRSATRKQNKAPLPARKS